MEPRIPQPAMTVPRVMPALQNIAKGAASVGLPTVTHRLVELRASQINGCAVCLDMHARELKALGESDARIATVAAWRETPYFTEAERAALALTEAVTRLADRPDPVADEVWDEAARHYSEQELAALVVSIATINLWNRLNASTRQVTGDWVEQWIHVPAPAGQAA